MRRSYYSYESGRGFFECVACGNEIIKKLKTINRCPFCGDNEGTDKGVIRYGWETKQLGYHRLIDKDDVASARSSMNKAKSIGVRFDTTHTLAGLLVRVVSLPVYTKVRAAPRGLARACM